MLLTMFAQAGLGTWCPQATCRQARWQEETARQDDDVIPHGDEGHEAGGCALRPLLQPYELLACTGVDR